VFHHLLARGVTLFNFLVKSRVLLIEDNEVNRYLATFLLSREGLEVIHAVNGRDGVERARAQAELLVEQAVAHLDLFEERAELLRQVARFVVNRRS